jgi:signal transduction histidine kinase
VKVPLGLDVMQGLTRLRRGSRSLRNQLICWNVLALTLLLGGLAVICRLAMETLTMQSVDVELTRSIEMYRRPPRFLPERMMSDPMRHGGMAPPPDAGQMRSCEGAKQPEGGNGLYGMMRPRRGRMRGPNANDPYRAHFFDRRGNTVMPEEERPIWDASALTRAVHGETVYSTVTAAGEPVRLITAVGYTPLGSMGLVQKGYPLKDIRRALGGVDAALLMLLPFGLLGAGWAGATLTGRVLQRVRRMTRAAADVSEADFTCRLPVSGEDEFAELAETFNGLLGRLERAFQEQQELLQLQQRFTADASHELKTPLTIVRGQASLGEQRPTTDERSRRAFGEIATAATTMSHLVQDLLLLARSDEGGMGRNRERIAVREVLEGAIEQALQDAAAPIRLWIEDEALCFYGNGLELTRLFRNLLDNAVRYTPAEGSITVTAGVASGEAVVTVKDTGPGIAPEHLPHLGERFYRVDASRTRPGGGTGLGLAICRGIVEAHHGAIHFESQLQVGTTVTVTLPASY